MPEPQRGDLVIRGGLVADAAHPLAEARDILVRDGVIVTIGPPGIAVPEGTAVFDASGLLLHPGLVNGHTHSHGFLGRGIGDRWTLELLLAASPWVSGGRTMDDIALSATIGAAELALKGCTAVLDMVGELPLPTEEGLDAVASAYDRVGLRAVIAPLVADRTLYQAIPPLAEALPGELREEVARLALPPWERTFDALVRLVRGWRWSGRGIGFGLGPTIPTHCDDAFLRACARLAGEHGLPLTMHVAESKVQAVIGGRTYGRSLVRHLDALGLIGPRFIAAHAIWLDDENRAILAARGASVIHNPSSNMKLGNGLSRCARRSMPGSRSGSAQTPAAAATTSTCTRQCASPRCCRRCRAPTRLPGCRQRRLIVPARRVLRGRSAFPASAGSRRARWPTSSSSISATRTGCRTAGR